MPSLASLAVYCSLVETAVSLPAPWGPGRWWPHRGHGKGHGGINVQLGPRPYYLVNDMDEGHLKNKLESCKEKPAYTSSFSIAHRGAPLQFPEHTKEGYLAGARMGAGIIECDVSFTSDRELVCRHSNCDLHYTTDILSRPELAAKCTEPFTPYDPDTNTDASALCCTSDITLAEFKSLCGLMEATVYDATNVSEYQGRIGSTPDWRTQLYSYECAETMSLKEQIELVDSLGLDFTAEAKTPEIEMPFQGDYTQQDFAQQIIDTYREMGIAPDRVWLQSFLPDDIFYWLQADPAFGAQAVYLDERADLSADGYETAVASLQNLADRGVRIVAPSIWQLVAADNATGTVVPSSYATTAKAAGLEIITWSFERSGPLYNGGGYYYTGINDLIDNDGDEYTVIDVVTREVGVSHIFSDWAATITYYANCFGLE